MADPLSNRAGGLSEMPPASRAELSGSPPDDIDVSLLEDSLRITPWQRLVENDRALALVRMLEQAGSRSNGTTHQAS
jgi:hypothetical protein